MDLARRPVQFPNDFIFALTSMLKNVVSDDNRSPVTGPYLHGPYLCQLAWPCAGWLKVCCPTIPVGSQPSSPVIGTENSAAGRSQGKK